MARTYHHTADPKGCITKALVFGLVILVLSVPTAPVHANPSLTGAVSFAADEFGNANYIEIWNTLGGENIHNLYVTDGGSAGAFINSGDADESQISLDLVDGTYTFTLFGENFGENAFASYGLNLFFDGDDAMPRVSAFAPRNTSPSPPHPPVSANSADTLQLNGAPVTGAGTLSYTSGATTVTLTDFVWSTPSIYQLDRVSPFQTTPSGNDDAVGQFTLSVVTSALYWDTDGAGTSGAGGAAPSGNWDGVTPNFNSDPAGGASGAITAVTTDAEAVVFAAGNGATGTYNVSVSGTQSAAEVNFEEGNVTLTGGTLAVGAFGVSAGTTGTVTSTIVAPASSLTKSGDGALQVSKLPQNHAVNITGGAVRVLESAPGLGSGHPAGSDASLSRPSSLNIAPGATLDLTNNDLILDYSGPSPIAAYEALVASGYNVTGDWLGDGITSSIAALDGNYVLAIADNATLAAPFGTAQGGSLFGGVDVDLDTILIKFTHRADINLDGVITPDDSAIFGGNYDENQPAVWATGDMNYDGVFTPDDAAIFGGAYDESLTSLPEPAGGVVFAVTAFALAGRRRWRR